MKEMKRIVLALILVFWVVGAPLATAQEAALSSLPGPLAMLGEWLELLVDGLVGDNPPVEQTSCDGSEDPEFHAYIIPGG